MAPLGGSRADRRSRARELLARVGLGDKHAPANTAVSVC